MAWPGGVHGGQARVHHFGPRPAQAVDDLADIGLVARYGVRGQHDQVALAHLDPFVLARGHERQGGHGLALRAGGDDANLAGREVERLFDVDQALLGDLQEAQLAGEGDVAPHRTPQRGHVAPRGDGGVGHLLDPVDVAGEAGHDHPLVPVGIEQAAQDPAHLLLRRRPPFFLGVGGVRQQQPDALAVAQGADAGQVRAPAVHRGQVELEVARVQYDALGGVEGQGEAVGDGVGHGDELDVEGADLAGLAVLHHHQLRCGPAGPPPRCGCGPGPRTARSRRWAGSHGAGDRPGPRSGPRGRG